MQLLYPLEINYPPHHKSDHPDRFNSPGSIGLENDRVVHCLEHPNMIVFFHTLCVPSKGRNY